MREKSVDFRMKLRRSEIFGNVVGVLAGLIIMSHMTMGAQNQVSTGTTVTMTPEMETCQCGVFLLGTQPLVFSADAKPILSGMPVPANCSAREDKLQCATICRQLIETMSQSHEDSPLVQTVVLAATRTLACQRFNESEKVPLPRNFDGTPPHHARLDDQTNQWKFMVGPLARSDLGSETDPHHMDGEHNNEADEDSDRTYLGKLTQPKYLGGFYRWCDEHWIYAGISLHEPLCCLQHLPKKCPTGKSARNGRRPRLIIRRCKNDDCSSEEDFQNLELSAETPSTSKTPPTTETLAADSEETETPDTFDNSTTSTEVETINPFDTTQAPVKNRKPLNSTVVAEAFKFVNSLMDSLGYGEFVQGITSVLPSSLASELIDRVDVGGWVSNYQDRYMKWPREFSMGYCYLEYSLYNMASDGFVATINNQLSRVFKPQSPSSSPSRGNMPPHHPVGQQPPPLPLGEVIQGSPPPVYGSNPNNVNNYISPMPPLPDNSFNAYGQAGLSGNRRVRRSPGVTVSRSYSSAVGGSESSPRLGVRRTVRRKISAPKARNAPPAQQSEAMVPVPMEVVLTNSSTSSVPVLLLAPAVPTIKASPEIGESSLSSSSFVPSSSFIPTNAQVSQSSSRYFSEPRQQVTPSNPHYNQYYQYELQHHQQQQQQYQQPQFQQYPQQPQVPVQRSHQQSQDPQSLTDYARPRRNPQGEYGNQLPQPRPRPPAKGKEGPPGGSLMNIANMLVQTAMSGNNQNNDGDKVTSIMQNALPLVSQVATNPAIQNMVSSLVTSFLTPPQANKPQPPPSPPPSQNLDDEEEFYDSQEDRPVKPKVPIRGEPVESNEIHEHELQSSNHRPSSSPPSNNSGGSSGDGSILSTMLSQMISTYIKHLFSPGPTNVNREPASNSNKPSRPSRPGDDTSSKPQPEGEKDVVDLITNTAKPFFISYFGVVPGEPGFGKLRISDRRDRLRFVNQKDGGQYTEILQNDPDPGTGVMDILMGSVNIPETGNGIYDFGNRVVYAFTKGNDPQQGMYCFKQYTVNKLWDYFRVGVRAVFKK